MLSAGACKEARLVTARLELRRMSPDLAPALQPLLNDWEVVRMLAEVPWPISVTEVAAHAARQSEPDPESVEFVILADRDAVGACTVKKPGSGNPPRIMPRLGYWVGRRFWNRGYATEALAAFINYVFRQFPEEKRIGAGVFRDNPASRRVLEKLGFKEEGGYELHCRSRGSAVPLADMLLYRAAWKATAP